MATTPSEMDAEESQHNSSRRSPHGTTGGHAENPLQHANTGI